jgi:Flp pilus assembly pilin Flp
MSLLRHIVQSPSHRGVTAVEYVLISAIIAVACISTMRALGGV